MADVAAENELAPIPELRSTSLSAALSVPKGMARSGGSVRNSRWRPRLVPYAPENRPPRPRPLQSTPESGRPERCLSRRAGANRARVGGSCHQIEPAYAWDDLVVPAD